MRGLYLNCDDTNLPASHELAQKYSKTFVFPAEWGKGKVVYSAQEWLAPPVFEHEGHVFIVAGWFLYKGKRNNLAQLACDIILEGAEVANNIEAGSFVILWRNKSSSCVIVDPFGLSSHFTDHCDEQLTVAPGVKALYCQNKHKINKTMVSILAKKNHLFGDYTIYDGIKRLTPGCIITKDKIKPYVVWSEKNALGLTELTREINNLSSHWDYENRVLPLSSGLDSRYILASSKFKNGFTYGPDGSPEIEITKQFSDDFDQYYSFDYNQEPLYPSEPELLNEMSFGVVNPIPRLLTNYLHVKSKFPESNAFFDGYLGDLFQRGTYINFKGVVGEIFKLFPVVYRLYKFSAENILRKRYKELTEDEFNLLLVDFKEKTAGVSLTDYQKVTYYEFIFGRGGRYTVLGSNIFAAQIFTVISPFAHRVIFETLIHQDFRDAVSYKIMGKLWSRVQHKYAQPKVESGYSPRSNPLLIPFIQIIYRLMFHFIPSRANYGVQLNRSQTKKDPSA